jgi:hypothetical protein
MFQCFNCSIHAKLLHSKSRNWMLTCRFRPVAVPSKWCNDCILLSSAKPCPSWTKECIIQFSCHICIVETSSFNLLITRSCAFDVSHVYDFASLSHSCGFSCTICGGDRVQIDSHHYLYWWDGLFVNPPLLKTTLPMIRESTRCFPPL